MSQRGRHRVPARHARPKPHLVPTKVIAGMVTFGLAAITISAQASVVPASGSGEFFNASALRQTNNEAVSLKRVSVSVSTKNISRKVKFSTLVKKDKSLSRGESVVRRKGAAGKAIIVYRVKYINGVEVSRSQVRRSIVRKPTARVVAQGIAAPSAEPTLPDPDTLPLKTVGQIKDFAASYIQHQYGWESAQFGCLSQLWDRESHWNANAHNSSSGAHGIPQALPGNKMASFGSDWYTNPATQVKWGAHYIKGRYGNPCGALGHSQSTGWY